MTTKKVRPSDQEAEDAIRLLITWLGDDPNRKELIKTPKRILNSYKKFFKGYNTSDEAIFKDSIFSSEKYNDMVILSNIDFLSHCEHHMVPITGKISVGYIPDKLIVGISKIIELINIFTKRLQLQERLTIEIANALNKFLNPKGVAVLVNATHDCIMCCEEQDKNNLIMHTSHMLGAFESDINTRQEFFLRIKSY